VDLVKLEGISADHVATLTGEQVYSGVRSWAGQFDTELVAVLDADRDLALRALAVEREGVENPRKDLRTWSDFRPAYGFFFPALFTPVSGPDDERLAAVGVRPQVATAFLTDFAEHYQQLPDPTEWFNQIRELAAKHGFAASPKEYRQDPDAYQGSIREASQLVRVALTGSTRSPDLYAITGALGVEEVLRRLRSVAGPA
jgi:glutamyl-tRNA synthetase